MPNELEGRKIAILAADGVEMVEFERPRDTVHDAGGQTELLSLQAGDIDARNHDLEPAGTLTAQRAVADASVDDYDGLILPGGTINPDKLRKDEAAVNFVRDFVNSGKPVAAICHGPWTLVEADVLSGRTLTSWPSIQTDIRNAGGEWVDEEVHVDSGLVTSRKPDDLDAFCSKLVEEVAEGVHSGQAASV